jgi:GntR family transcriptional regulator
LSSIAQLFAVSPEIGRSRYATIAEKLRAEITSGRWKAGSPIPAETALMQEFDVALGTMRQAIALLVNEGLLERQHGRGTFVHAGIVGASLMRFFRFGDSGAMQVPKSRIHKRQLVAPTAEVAARLGVRSGNEVLHIVRTRSLEGAPRLLENIWVDARRFAAMAASDPGEWGDLLYPEYAARCGVIVHRATDAIEFGALSASDAKLLQLPAKHPSALVTRNAFDIAGSCVEVRTTRGDANAFHYTVELT